MNKSEMEQMIISYIYGEMNSAEKKEFEKLMSENEELKKEVEALSMTREDISGWSEEEPPVQTLILPQNPSTGFWKHWMSVAATLLILVLFSLLTGFGFGVRDGNLVLGFNLPMDSNDNYTETFTKDDVNRIVRDAVTAYQSSVTSELTALSDKMDDQVEKLEASNNIQMQNAIASINVAGERRMQEYFAQLTREQRTQIDELFSKSTGEQQVYLTTLLNDFQGYIQQQRINDLEYMENYIGILKTNLDNKDNETREMIASLFTQVNTQTKAD